ncbi:MAG TPA: zf-HC2 domain-containing protein [Planctomycetota bacterium]|nr:zf-HC2 domain-containing protein [Planctomycetota bacterium]
MSMDCSEIAERLDAYLEKALSRQESSAVDAHLRECRACQNSVDCSQAVHGLISFVQAEQREAVAPLGSSEPRWMSVIGGAPWWGVSIVLHVLVVALAGLISMAISLPQNDDVMVTVTELSSRPPVQATAEPPAEKRDILHSKVDIPPTDPTSKELNNVVIPPDLLARAELGDHFETINPDRPDMHSAFGNEEARMFHSAQGSDEPEGGGGNEGATLDDMIGVGGASSPGSGGGWGGGHGAGIGVGTGSGRGSFGNRQGGGRKLMVKRFGGNKATEDAVDAALYWLARHQEADGHWDIKKHEGGDCVSGGTAYDEGVSALAVLAFLGAGHTTKIGKWKSTVTRGIEWLMSKQRADGAFAETRPCGYDQYDSMLSTLALAECYAMTKDPKIGAAAQKGVDYLVAQQKPDGGWNHGIYASASTLGWAVMTLKSAKVAGLKFDNSVFERAIKRLEDVSERDEGGYFGLVGYSRKGEYAYSKGLTCTAVGMVALQFMGQGHATEKMADILIKNLPAWKPENGIALEPQNFYHWYYATLGMFQIGGEHWKKWNKALITTILPQQRKGDAGGKDVDGSWDPVTGWDTTGGRVYSTAMGALCLEVYYRYALLEAQK